MRLEHKSKYYEIVKMKNNVYVHYGKHPRYDAQLPFGTFEVYKFNNSKLAQTYYDKKTSDKLEKDYFIYNNQYSKNKESYNMKWMIKNKNPKIKLMKVDKQSNKTYVKKTCPSGKVLNPKTGRCINTPKLKKTVAKLVNRQHVKKSSTSPNIKPKKTFKKIVLKKGELGKHGYKNIKSLKLKDRRKSLNNATNEYGAPKILKKINLLKTFQKNKNPQVASIYGNNMKWLRKKYDNQWKSSWKNSNLFK